MTACIHTASLHLSQNRVFSGMLPRGNRTWPILPPELYLGWIRGTLLVCPAQNYVKDRNFLNNMDGLWTMSWPSLAYWYRHSLKLIDNTTNLSFQILISNRPILAHKLFLNAFREKQQASTNLLFIHSFFQNIIPRTGSLENDPFWS